MIEHSIRPATKEDVRTLFEWRNAESTRRMFRNTEAVTWDDHVDWFDRRLKLDRPDLFIFEMDGRPVATFRIDHAGLSYTVAPECRNRGIAKLMLGEVRRCFGRLRAEIYPENLSSIRAAQNADLDVVIIDR